MAASTASILPNAKQIYRRYMGLLRAIDLIHGFRVYTTLFVMADLFQHGAQYLALLPFLERLLLLRSEAFNKAYREHPESISSATYMLGTLVLIVVSNLFLIPKIFPPNRRLPLYSLLYSGSRTGSSGNMLVIALAIGGFAVFISDAAALSEHPKVAMLLKVAKAVATASDRSEDPQKEEELQAEIEILDRAVPSKHTFLLVLFQVLSRILFVIALRCARQRKNWKVLP